MGLSKPKTLVLSDRNRCNLTQILKEYPGEYLRRAAQPRLSPQMYDLGRPTSVLECGYGFGVTDLI